MELLIEKLLGFVMVMTRISAFFLVAPVFGWRSIPSMIKVAAPVMLAIFFSITHPPAVTAEQTSAVQAVLLLGCEATYGLALGAVANVLFSAAKLGGKIAERQMGLSMAQVIDPFTQEHGAPIASLLEMVLALAFLAANGHHLLLKVIERSYEVFPAGDIPSAATLAGKMLEASSAMFVAGLRLAAPVLAAMLVLLVALAILARLVPEMNIFFISFPLRIGLGLAIVTVCVPFINDFVSEMAELMSKMLPL